MAHPASSKFEGPVALQNSSIIVLLKHLVEQVTNPELHIVRLDHHFALLPCVSHKAFDSVEYLSFCHEGETLIYIYAHMSYCEF